jgi:STE24 endopeptidase
MYSQRGVTSSSLPALEVTIALLALCSAWELYLLLRQRRMYALRTVPGPIAAAVTSITAKGRGTGALPSLVSLQESFVKSQLYGLDKSTVGITEHILGFFVTLLSLLFGALPFLYDSAAVAVAWLMPTYAGEITTTILFVSVTSLISWAFGLPLALYRIFVVEARHGFNKQTLKTFAYDTAVSFVLSFIVMAPTVAALITIYSWNPGMFFFYAWALLSILTVAFVVVYPVVISPLFNKFTPLSEGSLRDRIVSLARSEAFPVSLHLDLGSLAAVHVMSFYSLLVDSPQLSKVLVMDGSLRSSHSNAYFVGLCGAKQIVL